jgi:hypothetical protein
MKKNIKIMEEIQKEFLKKLVVNIDFKKKKWNV